MIIVKLYGGLGNQMFQYAFGKSFSIRYGIPLKLDISSLFEYRKYEMDIFNLDTDIATKEDMLLFDRRNLSLGKRVLFKIKHCFLKPLYISEKEGLELFIFPKKVSKNVHTNLKFEKRKTLISMSHTKNKSGTDPERNK